MNIRFKTAIMQRAAARRTSPGWAPINTAGVVHAWEHAQVYSVMMYDLQSQSIENSLYIDAETMKWRNLFAAFPEIDARFIHYYVALEVWNIDRQLSDREVACASFRAAAEDLDFRPSDWADEHGMPLEIQNYLRIEPRQN